MPFVFQYGSNCDADRLNGHSRLDGRAHDHGLVLTADRYELAFNKRHTRQGACADLIKPRRGGRQVWGVLYEISKADLKRMETDIEGPSYRRQRIALDGRAEKAWTFRVRQRARTANLSTTATYVQHIVQGLRDHGAPDEYVAYVIETALGTNRTAGAQNTPETQAIARLRNR